jgi:dihydrofolate reductase
MIEMRKVVLNLAVSLDGFIEGPNGEYDWCLTDQDYGMTEFFSTTDTIFIGRKSYEMVAGMEDEYFSAIKNIYVFSDTLAPVEHHKVEVINSAAFDTRVNAILKETGHDIWLFGGATLLNTFLSKKLVAALTLSVHPLILGGGKTLFQTLDNRVELMLTDTQTYSTGLVQLKYIMKPVFDDSLFDTQFTRAELDGF